MYVWLNNGTLNLLIQKACIDVCGNPAALATYQGVDSARNPPPRFHAGGLSFGRWPLQAEARYGIGLGRRVDEDAQIVAKLFHEVHLIVFLYR